MSVFPLALEKLGEAQNVIKMEGLGSYYAYLTQNSVIIRTGSSKDHSVISSFERSEASVHEFGYNHWIQWVRKSILAFGTCTGKCFLLSFENNNLELLTEVSLNVMITGTFSCHGVLGICSNNSHIYFVDGAGKIVRTYEFDFGTTGFKSPRFYYPMILTVIADDKPCCIYIPSNAITKQKKLAFSFFPIENATMLALNQTKGLLATALANGRAVLAKTTAPNAPPRDLLDVQKSPLVNDVIFLQWINEDSILCIIQRDGLITMYNANTGRSARTAVAALTTATSICYDECTSSLICTNNTDINRIEFANIRSGYAFTCSRIFNYESGASDCIHNVLFPYKNVIKGENIWVIQSDGAVGVVQKGELKTLKCDVRGVVLYDEYLFVFMMENDKYFYAIYDLELKQLCKNELPHAVHVVRRSWSHIVISCHSMYTHLEIYDEPEKSAVEVIPGKMFVEMNTETSKYQIKDAVYVNKLGVVVHSWDSRVTFSEKKQLEEYSVSYILYHDEPEMLFMQRIGGFSVIYDNSIFKFDDAVCLYTNGCDVCDLIPECTFGELRFQILRIAPHIIFSQKSYDEILAIYSRFDIISILAMTLAMGSYREHIPKLIDLSNHICEKYKEDVIAKVIRETFRLLDGPQRNVFFACPINWCYFFDSLDETTQEYVLMYVTTRNFETLIRDKFDSPFLQNSSNIERFVKKAVEQRRHIRAFRMAYETGADFIELVRTDPAFTEHNLEILIHQFETEAKRWRLSDDDFVLRFMGTTFSKANMNVVALSIFTVLQETPKIKALLLVDDHLRDLVTQYIKKDPPLPQAHLLKECLPEQ